MQVEDSISELSSHLGTIEELSQARLEQEKSQNMSLSGMLTEARTSYETLRTEFYQIERNRRSSRLKAKDCAKISNLREKLVAHWKAPASN